MLEWAICLGTCAALLSFFLAWAIPAHSNDCPGHWIKIGRLVLISRWN